MYKSSAKNLLDLSKAEVESWLESFDAVFTDCDGVLWNHETAISGSPETVNSLQKSGKKVYFITCNGTKTRKRLHEQAKNLGFQVEEQDILCPSYEMTQYLKNLDFKKKAYVIGTESIIEELASAGIKGFGIGPDVLDVEMAEYLSKEIVPKEKSENVGAVIISFDEHFCLPKMLKASNYLDKPDCLFMASNIDRVSKFPNFCIPGTGALVTAVETSSGRKAEVFSKPNPKVVENLIKSGAIVPERTLMVGDCIQVDMTFGKNCGFQTLLVGTGQYQIEKLQEMIKSDSIENKNNIPDLYVPKLGDLLQYLKK